jgi:hypothetical protein
MTELGKLLLNETKANIRRLTIELVAAQAERDRYCEMVMRVRQICDDDRAMANARTLQDEADALSALYDKIVSVVYNAGSDV